MGNRQRARGPIGRVSKEPVTFLVCFAVKEEAKFFLPHLSRAGSVQGWVTGMGRRNAAESIREAVAAVEPECVLTCGFAGGLNPELTLGAVVFDHDFDAGVEKSLLEIGAEIERLGNAAKNGTIPSADLSGSGFTITSLGTQGGLFATPVLNFPEVGILGVHQIKKRPVVRNDEIVIGEIMLLSLSFDHRIVDGHIGAAFAYDIIGYLENPETLMLEMV